MSNGTEVKVTFLIFVALFLSFVSLWSLGTIFLEKFPWEELIRKYGTNIILGGMGLLLLLVLTEKKST